MDTRYDTNKWESETSLGRTLFIYNYGMRGNEFTGWELIKTVVTDHEPGVREKTYLWSRKSSKEEVIRVSIIETPSWRDALQHLKMQLEHCMRPEVPRARDQAAAVGDIQYAGEGPNARGVAALFFSRGNLQVSVSSAGTKPVDVGKLAKELDDRFVKPPARTAKAAHKALKPAAVVVKEGEETLLVEQLPEPVPRSGWLRVSVPDGELRREGDSLYYTSEKAGRKSVQIVNLSLE